MHLGRYYVIPEEVALMLIVGRTHDHSGLEIIGFSLFGNLCPEVSWLSWEEQPGQSSSASHQLPPSAAHGTLLLAPLCFGKDLSLANPAQEQRSRTSETIVDVVGFLISSGPASSSMRIVLRGLRECESHCVGSCPRQPSCSCAQPHFPLPLCHIPQ